MMSKRIVPHVEQRAYRADTRQSCSRVRNVVCLAPLMGVMGTAESCKSRSFKYYSLTCPVQVVQGPAAGLEALLRAVHRHKEVATGHYSPCSSNSCRRCDKRPSPSCLCLSHVQHRKGARAVTRQVPRHTAQSSLGHAAYG